MQAEEFTTQHGSICYLLTHCSWHHSLITVSSAAVQPNQNVSLASNASKKQTEKSRIGIIYSCDVARVSARSCCCCVLYTVCTVRQPMPDIPVGLLAPCWKLQQNLYYRHNWFTRESFSENVGFLISDEKDDIHTITYRTLYSIDSKPQ